MIIEENPKKVKEGLDQKFGAEMVHALIFVLIALSLLIVLCIVLTIVCYKVK